jgi:hypothetical protein
VLLAGPSRDVRGPVGAQRWIGIGGAGTGALTGAPVDHESVSLLDAPEARRRQAAEPATASPGISPR